MKLMRMRYHPSPAAKRAALRKWYQMMAERYAEIGLWFMNYGFVETDPHAIPLSLDPADEAYRHQIQLYHHVAGAVDIRDKQVVEVGCGRGGGASFVMRYLRPQSMTGIDYATNAIRLCKKYHSIPGLCFLVGDAEKLPFHQESFDIVLNVESCHAYPFQDNFFAEVRRILRFGGYFLLTDFRSPVGLDELRRALFRSGLKMLDEKNITRNVFLSMEQENREKLELIEKITPPEMRQEFEEFAGTEGSPIYEGLKNGDARYVSYVLQKI